jgi:type IV fimbrial biogenesis protein FimT
MQKINCPEIKEILQDKGFTLVELMVTISIVTILLAIAVPNMSAFISGNRVSTAVNEFVGAIALARSEAIKQGRLVTICLSVNATATTPSCATGGTDWTSGWLVYVESSTTSNVGTYETAEIILARQPAFANNILIPSNATRITFNSSGQPITTTTNSFNFSYNNLYGRQVCMERTGRVKTIPNGNSGSC